MALLDVGGCCDVNLSVYIELWHFLFLLCGLPHFIVLNGKPVWFFLKESFPKNVIHPSLGSTVSHYVTSDWGFLNATSPQYHHNIKKAQWNTPWFREIMSATSDLNASYVWSTAETAIHQQRWRRHICNSSHVPPCWQENQCSSL